MYTSTVHESGSNPGTVVGVVSGDVVADGAVVGVVSGVVCAEVIATVGVVPPSSPVWVITATMAAATRAAPPIAMGSQLKRVAVTGGWAGGGGGGGGVAAVEIAAPQMAQNRLPGGAGCPLGHIEVPVTMVLPNCLTG
jgi:hypothetical protein